MKQKNIIVVAALLFTFILAVLIRPVLIGSAIKSESGQATVRIIYLAPAKASCTLYSNFFGKWKETPLKYWFTSAHYFTLKRNCYKWNVLCKKNGKKDWLFQQDMKVFTANSENICEGSIKSSKKILDDTNINRLEIILQRYEKNDIIDYMSRITEEMVEKAVEDYFKERVAKIVARAVAKFYKKKLLEIFNNKKFQQNLEKAWTSSCYCLSSLHHKLSTSFTIKDKITSQYKSLTLLKLEAKSKNSMLQIDLHENHGKIKYNIYGVLPFTLRIRGFSSNGKVVIDTTAEEKVKIVLEGKW